MKRWVGVVVLLYFLLLPFCWEAVDCAFLSRCWRGGFAATVASVASAAVKDDLSLLTGADWRTWIPLLPPVLSLAVCLTVPLAVVEGRLIRRGVLLGATVATGFMATLQVVGAELIGFDVLDFFHISPRVELLIGIPVLAWGAWSVGFWRRRQQAPALRLILRQCGLLLVSSLVVVLISVPAYAYLMAAEAARYELFEFAGLPTLLGRLLGLAGLLFSGGLTLFSWVARRHGGVICAKR